ncbi:plasmid-partitioning protein (plasmid) [Chlamydia serpentis]|uniref:Plasmid-partitioning protein n=1 Tax=Chlamydia serpentis TaxID=1967782 RepID=A0A2R8FCN8_9CHLA|nr:ParA family protein [Chlamydia serpentis]SPN74183.1 plasmid-partitioning protein [Chlamydia serpentis]
MKTIAFCSFKGGTGKTTLSLNIGCNLAQYHNKKVLLVDLDPQANLTTGLGTQFCSDTSLYDIFRNSGNLKDVIQRSKIKNLDIIPSSLLIEDFRVINKDSSLNINCLRSYLQLIEHNYDVCILDTPPSLGCLNREAFIAANFLIICLTPEPFSILGAQKIKEFCSTLQTENELEILGIVFSFWDDRNATNSTYLNIIESIYENKILSSKVRRDVKLSRSLLKETSVANAYPNSRANYDLLELTKEIETRLFKNVSGKRCEQTN